MLWLLVTGSREIKDIPENRTTVGDEVVMATTDTEATLLVGDARGLDDLALKLWLSDNNPNRERWRRFEANWDKHGRRAGPRRNEQMVKFVTAQDGDKVCLAFFQRGAGNRGTAHCANYARNHGIDVREIWIP